MPKVDPTLSATHANPVRTCIGCGSRAPKEGLLRLHIGEDGRVHLDANGTAGGRGAHVHPTEACLIGAEAPRAVGRAFRGKARPPEPGKLRDEASARRGPPVRREPEG